MARQINHDAQLTHHGKRRADRPLPEQVAERLTRLIVDESYRAGHKLPNEHFLAERLGVGRSTIREAVKLLASRNVVEVRHGSGTYVSESTGMVEDPLGFRFYRNKKRLTIDLCEIRVMLEPQIAAAAARTATPEQIALLEALARKVAEQIEADVDHSAADVELHRKIAEASGNVVAPGIVGILSTAIPLFVKVSERSLKRETIVTHRKVIDAIARRNPAQAKKAMQEHIEHNRAIFESLPEDE